MIENCLQLADKMILLLKNVTFFKTADTIITMSLVAAYWALCSLVFDELENCQHAFKKPREYFEQHAWFMTRRHVVQLWIFFVSH